MANLLILLGLLALIVTSREPVRSPMGGPRLSSPKLAALLVTAILAIIASCDHKTTTSTAVTPAPVTTPPVSPTPIATDPVASLAVPPGAQIATVAKIVDGDTIWVTVDQAGGPLPPAATHKTRLLEYDAPEATSQLECFGPEATQALAKLIPVGSVIWLVQDRENADRYQRFLRYVWSSSGTFVNFEMVRDGFGEAVLYEPNDRYIREMRAAEAEAKAANRGMWGPPCDYDTPSPHPAAKAPKSAGQVGCDPNYSGACVPPYPPDVDCGDIPEKDFRVVESDPHRLDGGGDGLACES